MFYKISKNGKDIDVFTELAYCKYEPQSKMVIVCSPEDTPQGVISVRRDTYYHVEGWADFGIPCQSVRLTTITESEYNELYKQFEDEKRESEIVKELVEKVQNQDTSIEDLEDAVLELAEIIGG